MPDYKESTLEGKQWQRCKSVFIDNKVGAVPMCHFGEETAVSIGGETITKELAGISFPFNPNEVIPLLNPETGAATGSSMTAAEVYVALFSMYLKKALERDGV